MKKEKPYEVIGIIDSYGAIHHRPKWAGRTDHQHEYYWPGHTHKRWRFDLADWQLSNSALSKNELTEAERLDVEATVRKYYTPPNWLIKCEEWETLGRPRSGKAYEKHCRKWDEIFAKKA